MIEQKWKVRTFQIVALHISANDFLLIAVTFRVSSQTGYENLQQCIHSASAAKPSCTNRIQA